MKHAIEDALRPEHDAPVVPPVKNAAFDGLRVLLGAIWLLNACFQAYAWVLRPRAQANATLLHAYAKPISSAPAWLHPYLTLIVHGIQVVGPHDVALAMVVIDLVVALSLITGRWVWWCSWLGIAYCLFCWTTLDSFGYPYSQGQTDPGVFVNYVLTFVFVLSAYASARVRPGERPTEYDPFRLARILFGLLWVVDAVLKWQPYFLTHFTAQLTGVLPGQPMWIAAFIHFVIRVVQAIGPIIVAIVVASVETLIALSLLARRGMRLVVPVGALYCLAVWTTAEGWGGPYTSSGTGVRGNVVGNVIIYVVMFLYLWVAMTLSSPRAKADLSRLA